MLLSIPLFNAIRIGVLPLWNSEKRVLKKAELLIEKAHTFEEKQLLRTLGMNNINGFCYRFDEHLEEAVFENNNPHREKVHKDVDSFGFEFNGDEDLQFTPTEGEYILEGGVLKFKCVEGSYFQNTTDLKVTKDRLSEIALRMKLQKGRTIQLSWSVDGDTQWKKWITIDVIPDNAFHVYRINVKNVLKAFHELDYHIGLSGEESIKKVFLRPSDSANDDIEIDYIRFISKREKYHKEPCGETYETINK